MKICYALFATALGLASCNNKESTTTDLRKDEAAVPENVVKPPPQPDPPTIAEVKPVVGTLISRLQVTSSYNFGEPMNCVPGTMNGVLVNSCQVCVALLLVPRTVTSADNVRVAMLLFPIAFKRAISVDQPEVQPLDGQPGVWVGSIPQAAGPFQPAPPPSYQIIKDVGLAPADFDDAGGGFKPDGRYSSNGFGYVSGTDLFNRMSPSMKTRLISDKIGSCESPRREPLPPRNNISANTSGGSDDAAMNAADAMAAATN